MGNTSSSNKASSPSSTTPATLSLLRNSPEAFFKAYGVMVRTQGGYDAVAGGRCTLTLLSTATPNVFKIEVSGASGNDWYIPYQDKEARFIDVPRGLPDGTLVVTHPMNGCALSVHATATGHNRFFHDADGKYMSKSPHSETAEEKFRVTSAQYSGASRPLEEESKKLVELGTFQNFEHTIISLKRGKNWEVYNSAIITTLNFEMVKVPTWFNNKDIPQKVGSFLD